jgi:hypothetical protein
MSIIDIIIDAFFPLALDPKVKLHILPQSLTSVQSSQNRLDMAIFFSEGKKMIKA